MNCDTFLADLETGDLLKRHQARRHARTCAGCAKALEALHAAKAELAISPPLSPELRRLWGQAAETSVVRLPSRNPNPARFAAAVVVACLLLVAVGISFWKPTSHPPGKEIADLVPAHETDRPPTVVVIDPVGELSDLARAVDELDAELKALERFAERREVERQFAVLLQRADAW